MDLAFSNGRIRRPVAVMLAFGAILAIALAAVGWHYARRPISLKGAIIQEDPDTRKQSPITDVDVTVANDLASADSISDFSGFFRVTLRRGIKRDRKSTRLNSSHHGI